MPHQDIIQYQLIRTNRRLTFDITWQREDTRYKGPDDGDYFVFTASNGYQVISRSRMDIQTERLWLIGALDNERSGTMVFSSNKKRDRAYDNFMLALDEWCDCVRAGKFGPVSAATGYHTAQFMGNEVNAAVDPFPLVYRSRNLNGIRYLQRVIGCSGAGESSWALGAAHPSTDFARISHPLPPGQVPALLETLTSQLASAPAFPKGIFSVVAFRTEADYWDVFPHEEGGFATLDEAVARASDACFNNFYEVIVTGGYGDGAVYARFNVEAVVKREHA
jgi:hypothetical protein